jgi:hypothetical protein
MVSIYYFIGADHASNCVTRRSQTCKVIFLSKAPAVWYSKRQSTVKSSTFGSKYIAMKTSVEMLQSLRYKLRSFGIRIDGPVTVFGDNKSVINSSQKPDATLTKMHNNIAYHKTREVVASGMIRVGYTNNLLYLADVLTKPLPKEKRDALINFFMY